MGGRGSGSSMSTGGGGNASFESAKKDVSKYRAQGDTLASKMVRERRSGGVNSETQREYNKARDLQDKAANKAVMSATDKQLQDAADKGIKNYTNNTVGRPNSETRDDINRLSGTNKNGTPTKRALDYAGEQFHRYVTNALGLPYGTSWGTSEEVKKRIAPFVCKAARKYRGKV